MEHRNCIAGVRVEAHGEKVVIQGNIDVSKAAKLQENDMLGLERTRIGLACAAILLPENKVYIKLCSVKHNELSRTPLLFSRVA